MYRWNKELVKRNQEEDRKYFDDMFKDLEIEYLDTYTSVKLTEL